MAGGSSGRESPGEQHASKHRKTRTLSFASGDVFEAAGECNAAGPGLDGEHLVQRLETSFTITASESARLMYLGKASFPFRVTVRGPGRVDPVISDNSDGTHTVRLIYPMSGKYQVRIGSVMGSGGWEPSTCTMASSCSPSSSEIRRIHSSS